MIAIAQISPILLVIAMILLFRRPPEQAAIGGAALAAILWAAGLGARVTPETATAIGFDTAVLFGSIAAVILPGLAFVMSIEPGGSNQALVDWIRRLGWSSGQQVIFIVLGLAPMLEAMTGFGVSLIATVPLLLSLVERNRALRIALAGMGIMPWGILGLPTLVGAKLAHLRPALLGQLSTIASAPVFLALVVMALWISGRRGMGIYAAGILAWLVFMTTLFWLNRTAGPELAGVGAGACVVLIGVLVARLQRCSSLSFPREAWPYLALLGVLLAVRLAVAATGTDSALVVHGVDISWNPLTSPGPALLIVSLTSMLRARQAVSAETLARRAAKPLLTIVFFLLMSQLLVKAGFLDSLRPALGRLDQATLTPLIAVLGVLSGYVTGSNIGGNAVAMSSIAYLGSAHLNWLAALQNSAAGHGALGSLPIVALIVGLARPSREEEHRLVRFGFLLVVANMIMLAGVGILFVYCNAFLDWD